MIVTAFAQGDRRTLKDLLSPEVYDGFDAAIREREQRGETVETRFVGIDKAEITGAELRGRTSRSVTVRFISQIVSVTRDKAGAVVDGSCRQGDRRHRRVDFRPRCRLPRSELETGCDRSGPVGAFVDVSSSSPPRSGRGA